MSIRRRAVVGLLVGEDKVEMNRVKPGWKTWKLSVFGVVAILSIQATIALGVWISSTIKVWKYSSVR